MVFATRAHVLADSIRRLLRRNAKANLNKLLAKSHPSDIAGVFRLISPKERLAVFALLPHIEFKAEALSETDDAIRKEMVKELSQDLLVDLLRTMASDDAAEILGDLEEEQREQILQRMKAADSEPVEELLSFPENTAGRIMSPNFFSLPEHVSAKDAQKEIRKAAEAEMVFYAYVTDQEGKLVGVASLRDLVVVPPHTPLSAIMTSDIVKVRPDIDQEDVARIVAQYNLLAVPVVDVDDRMIGIVTVDDVVDVIRDEATEDILRMAGTTEEEILSFSILRAVRTRLPWLFAAFIGGCLAWFIIDHFEQTLSKVVLLAAFLPVILGMGGNIGTQSSSITIRGLATGRIHTGDFWSVISKQAVVGLLLGLAYSAFLFGVAYASSRAGLTNVSPFRLGVVVAVSIATNMTLAATLGVILPMFFQRMRIDPAVASGPFVTTAIDILGVSVYFGLATAILL